MRAMIGLLLCVVVEVSAEPLVIRDYGGYGSGVPDKARIMAAAASAPVRPPASVLASRFPLTSSLRPGVMNTPRKMPVKTVNKNPFFIVGNDERSRQWIADNKAYLQKIQATGLVTNLASEADFRSLTVWAEPLKLVAVPLNELVQTLGLQVYPVLITPEEIAQ